MRKIYAILLFKEISLVWFNGTMNTVRSFWCQGCVQTDVLSGNHKTNSAALFNLLITETIEALKKRNRTVRVTNIQKENVEKDNIIASKINKAVVPLGCSNTA